VTAQEELILAARLASTASESRSIQNAQALLESARRRLEYWDIPFDEIRAIEESGKVRRTLTLRSPASGIVMEKTVVEGDRIMPGMITFRIADLSTTWVEADVFEKDLDLVRVGQRAHVTFESFPGRSFAAQVTYVYPTVSVGARTGRVRLELPNTGEELRPGMYADVELSIAPGAPTLIVPRSAVLSTGTRVLVFVSGEGGALDAREVTVGRTSGREIEVLSGLSEGDRVVSSSAFLVDAESSLGALRTGGGKPSPAEGDGSMDPPGHSPGG
jgi:RND family efflux transporter MFP subunit